MAIITYPLNNIDYQAEDAELFHCTRTSGIYASGHFPVSVTGLDNGITIGKGIGWIRNTEFSGKVFASKEPISLNAGVPDASLPRIDAVVIQFDANANETNIIIKQGTTGSTPTAPEVERGEYIYELHLYHIRRKAGATAITPGDITDLRMDANYCGLMADSVTQVDMSAINAQVREFISDWESQIANVTDGRMVESPEYPGCYYRLNGGMVEWLNPPMMVGKEYRLSQRDDGKRVYTKMVKFESIKGYSELAVSGVEKIVSISAVVERLLTDSSGRTFFQVPCSDVPPETDRVAALNRTQVYFYDSKICVDFAMRRGRYDLYVTINYTRSDDVEYTSAYADGDSLYIDTSGATTQSGSTVTTELYATVDSGGGEYVNSFVINGNRYDLATNLADSGEPSSSLPGNVGQIYTDLDTKKTYVCISANSTSGDYKWVPVVSDPFYTSELRLKHGTGIRFSKIVADENKIEIKNPISDTIVRGVATPTSDNDAANKAYVDSKVGSGSGQNVDLTGYAKEAWVQEGFQPKGNYLTEVPDGYAKTEDIPTEPEDIGAQPKGNYASPDDIPKVPNWAMQASKPAYTASEVGADPTGTAASAVSAHNTNAESHSDIRLEIKTIREQLADFLDADEETLNELSELIAAISANQTSIAQLTTGKVSVSDIIDNLTTNVANKPLSAAQGVVIKGLIDGLSSGKLDASKLSEAINTALAQAKANGEFDGAKGDPGRGIKSIARTSGNGAAGTTDTYTITYTDNTTGTFQVRNGANGAPGGDGYTPQRGVDYWTPDDIAAIDADIATELAKRGQLKPEFAQSLEWLQENGDQTKLYVLHDGMIYAWMLTEKEVTTGPSYTNALDGITKNINKRWSHSSKALSNADGYMTVVDVPVKSGQEVYVNVPSIAFMGNYPRIVYRDASGNYVSGELDRGAASKIVITSENGMSHWTAGYVMSESGVASSNTLLAGAADIASMNIVFNAYYVKIGQSVATNGAITEEDVADYIVSIGNPIVEGGGTEIVKEYAWASTGHAFVPADYEDRIVAVEKKATNNTARIVALEKSVETGGADETEKAALDRIQKWDKPVYDSAPVTLIADDRVKPALTTNDRTIPAIYAKYRALMAAHPGYIKETNMGKSAGSSTFTAVDMLRFDFCEPGGLTQPDLADSARHETKPTLIFLSGIHTEWAGVWGLYYALEEIATNPDFDDVRRNARIVVIPCANPACLAWTTAVDGWRMSHVNANGVAIHNNFGVNHSTSGNVGEYNYGGSAPYSEPETQYIDAVMAEFPDAVAFVSCHNNDYSTYYGSHVIWASSATYHMCNVAFRLVDKLTKAWLNKYGQTLKDSIDQYKINMDANDYRLGRATMSTSKGTEQLNATKYGVMGVNLEIARMMKVFSGNTDGTSEVMTHGAEVYANFMRTLLWSYDPKDKKEYAPNLPWAE